MKVDYEKMESCKKDMLSVLSDMEKNSDSIKSYTDGAGSSEKWAGKSYDSFKKNQGDLLTGMKECIECLKKISENITLAVSNFKQVDEIVQNQITANNP